MFFCISFAAAVQKCRRRTRTSLTGGGHAGTRVSTLGSRPSRPWPTYENLSYRRWACRYLDVDTGFTTAVTAVRVALSANVSPFAFFLAVFARVPTTLTAVHVGVQQALGESWLCW